MRKIAMRICNSCSRKTGGSSMLNKVATYAYKTRADWLDYFYSPWESKGYKVENQKYV